LSGRGLCDELITRPEESYRLRCVVVCDLETSRMGAPYIYDISHLRVKQLSICIISLIAHHNSLFGVSISLLLITEMIYVNNAASNVWTTETMLKGNAVFRLYDENINIGQIPPAEVYSLKWTRFLSFSEFLVGLFVSIVTASCELLWVSCYSAVQEER